jgi:hypothetical protein
MSAEEFDQLQDVTVQFIEATKRAIKKNYITEDMMEMMDPSLMFAIPRLAIVWYVLVCTYLYRFVLMQKNHCCTSVISWMYVVCV